MYKHFLSLLFVFQFYLVKAQTSLPVMQSADAPPLHHTWDSLLQAHVSGKGLVDYQGFSNDREQLQAYLDLLDSHIPGRNWSREAQLVYFINLYNAATVQLILDHYPVASIRDIPKPWGRKFIRIAGEAYSLKTIEHEILRKMGEPRIHFGINCASISCPQLLNFAFTEAELEDQLEEATRQFINDGERNAFDGGHAAISKIFKWYRKDFTKAGSSLTEYLNTYLVESIPVDTKLEYLPYDWSLNKQ